MWRPHVVWLVLTVGLLLSAEEPVAERPRLEGYVGGPYKLLVRDFTGDGHADVLAGYRNLSLIHI